MAHAPEAVRAKRSSVSGGMRNGDPERRRRTGFRQGRANGTGPLQRREGSGFSIAAISTAIVLVWPSGGAGTGNQRQNEAQEHKNGQGYWYEHWIPGSVAVTEAL